MIQTFINLRFEQIEKRFKEVELLLSLAITYQDDNETYQSLCRSAHVLMVSHIEGLYKDISKDIIDDLNSNTNFDQIKKPIFNSHCSFFIHTIESDKSTLKIQEKLWNAFKDYPTSLKIEPFLFIDNKNPAPQIIETILEKFGVKNFFWSLKDSDLDVVFEDEKKKTQKLHDRLIKYIKKGTMNFPYTVDSSFYNPKTKTGEKKVTTLWEDFLNNFLKERHNIIHGNRLDNPNNHDSLLLSKMKIEILLFAFIINICSISNPLIFLPEKK